MLKKDAIHTRINLPTRTAYNKCRPVWLQIYAWTNLNCKQTLVLEMVTHQWSSCKKQKHLQIMCWRLRSIYIWIVKCILPLLTQSLTPGGWHKSSFNLQNSYKLITLYWEIYKNAWYVITSTVTRQQNNYITLCLSSSEAGWKNSGGWSYKTVAL